jgi:hypothetical protein
VLVTDNGAVPVATVLINYPDKFIVPPTSNVYAGVELLIPNYFVVVFQ